MGLGDLTPALADNRLFVFVRQGEEEVMLCLDPSNGRELWQNRYAAVPVTGPAEKYAGPRSSPTVAHGKIVALGVGGILSCLETATGKVVWRNQEYAQVLPRFFTAMSPMIVGEACLAHLGGQDKGTVVAFDLATGVPKWSWPGAGPAYASPVLMEVAGTKQIVIQTERSVVGLALADGRLLWQVPVSPKPGYWNSATPVIDGQTVIYTGQGRGTDAIKIVPQEDGFTVQALWSNPQFGTVYNSPVLKDGRLFGLSDRGYFFCLNAETGQTHWAATNRVSNFGSLLDAGSVLLALPEKSGLIAIKPGAKQYEELVRWPVSDTPVYAHPVVAGKRIFVKDRTTVSLWVIE